MIHLNKSLNKLPKIIGFKFSSEKSLQKAEKYVNQQFRSKSWSSFVLSSYYPPQLRIPFAAINMLDLQLIKIVQNARQPSLALGKMQFWQSTISKIYTKQPLDNEPISLCLEKACNNNPLTKGYFMRLIHSRIDEINNRQIDTVEKMLQMAENSKSTHLALNLELLRVDITTPEMAIIVSNLGRAVILYDDPFQIGLCEYLKRVPYGLRNNRFLLPSDVLAKYNLNNKSIWDRTRGKPSENFFDAVLEIASYAKKAFEISVNTYEKNKDNMPKHAFRGLLKGVQVQMYLVDLEKYNFDIFSRGMNKNHPFRLPYRTYYAARDKKFYYGELMKK